MRSTNFASWRFDEFDFVRLFLGGPVHTEAAEAVIENEIGIDHVGFA